MFLLICNKRNPILGQYLHKLKIAVYYITYQLKKSIMKKIMVTLFVTLFLITGTYAKTSKAPIYVGGSLGLSHSSLKGAGGAATSGTSISFVPNIGYELNKKYSIGISLGLMKGYAALGSFDINDIKSMIKGTLSTYIEINNMNIGGILVAPYVRYNLLPGKKLNVFIDGVFSYNNISVKREQGSGEARVDKFSAFGLFGKPGLAFKFDKHFSIVCHLGSVGVQSGEMSTSTTSLTRFGIDLDTSNMLLGFEYHF